MANKKGKKQSASTTYDNKGREMDTAGNPIEKYDDYKEQKNRARRTAFKSREERGKQGRKDSSSKRINLDNARLSKIEESSSDNDVRWYMHNPEMFKAAGSIGFADVNGLPLPFIDSGQTLHAVPGIMKLAWSPNILGYGNSAIVTQTMNSIYSYVVHANSRNQSYSAQDQMIMILAGASVFSLISYATRLYGIMKYYNGLNLYTPKKLINAMGADYEDLKDNLSNMWFDLNRIIASSKQIWIPNTMPLTERWYWLNANVYTDANTVKSQFYVFVPNYFYTFSASRFDDGGSLEPLSIQRVSGSGSVFSPAHPTLNANGTIKEGALYTWDEIVQACDTAINNLAFSADRGLIFGDILRAYGADKLYALPEINANYLIAPVYNAEVLTQIENATLTGLLAPKSIKQNQTTEELERFDDGIIYPIYGQKQLGAAIPATKVINFHYAGQPSPEAIMVATRLMQGQAFNSVQQQWQGGGTWKNYITTDYRTAATEILTDATTYTRTINSGVESYLLRSYVGYENVTNTNLQDWYPFDWAPALYYHATMDAVSGLPAPDALGCVMDYDNWAAINDTSLRKLHTTALMSEFGAPVI